LNCVVTTFVNLSLILLPLYASDFPSDNKGNYFRLLVEWHKRSKRVIEHFVSELSGRQISGAHGRVSVKDFVERAQRLDIFEVMMIRQIAKNTVMVELPRDSVAS